MKKILFLTILSAVLTGCVGVQTADRGKDMVYVQNENLLLFACLPICSGDPDYPNDEVANWWEDTVNVKTNVRLLEEIRDERHARALANISTYPREDWIFWPFLKRNILGTSAELVK